MQVGGRKDYGTRAEGEGGESQYEFDFKRAHKIGRQQFVVLKAATKTYPSGEGFYVDVGVKGPGVSIEDATKTGTRVRTHTPPALEGQVLEILDAIDPFAAEKIREGLEVSLDDEYLAGWKGLAGVLVLGTEGGQGKFAGQARVLEWDSFNEEPTQQTSAPPQTKQQSASAQLPIDGVFGDDDVPF